MIESHGTTPLWNRTPALADWAPLHEGFGHPLYHRILQSIPHRPGHSLLDVGCGTGAFCHLASSQLARVVGVDTSHTLLEIARKRHGKAEFHEADLANLPFPDGGFDIVAALNPIQRADLPRARLPEALRVARRGAAIVLAGPGAPKHCDIPRCLTSIRQLLQLEPPASTDSIPDAEPQSLEAVALDLGLSPVAVGEVECPWIFPEAETAAAELMDGSQALRALQRRDEQGLRDAVMEALAPFKTSAGAYVLRNQCRYLIALTNCSLADWVA